MENRPNILLILADSALQHVYGCYGGPARTPHADRLAAEGVRFTHAYTAAPICHPARSVIDTGLFPHANGMITNRCSRGAYPFRVFDHVPSLAALLGQAGYRTGYAGQGHIDVRGFDDDCSYPTAEFHAWLRRKGLQEKAQPDYQYRSCGRLEGDLETARDTQFGSAAVRLIEEYAAGDRPWFLQCDFDGPHPPCLVPAPADIMYEPDSVTLPASRRDPLTDVPAAVRNARHAQGGERWSDEDWRRYIAHFYGMTTVIDTLVGRVLAALDGCGMAERTLVIFSSDHGGLMGAHGFVMHGSPAMFDPVMRVPFIVRWPGVAPEGAERSAFISHADLLPTLLQAAGADGPPTHGQSLLSLLRGAEALDDGRDDIYSQYSGDGIMFYSARMLRTREWGYTFAPHGGEELYDLRSDPGERHNRAADPAAAAGLREMRSRLAGWMERVDDPLRGTGIFRTTLEG